MSSANIATTKMSRSLMISASVENTSMSLSS
jgi:hypothetical protein